MSWQIQASISARPTCSKVNATTCYIKISHKFGLLKLDLEIRMDDHDWIWRPDGGQRHRLLRLAPVRAQICRRANVRQNTRSRHQSKEEVMYITPIPCTSTLDPYKWRNQSWKYDGVHHELHVFAKLKAQIRCLY